jgi:hypothetical protein
MRPGEIHCVGQIVPGISQSPVEVEHDQVYGFLHRTLSKIDFKNVSVKLAFPTSAKVLLVFGYIADLQ